MLELLDMKAGKWDYRGRVELYPVSLEALPKVAPDDIRELIAALMTYHLRTAAMVEPVSEGVSQDTPASEAETGQPAEAELVPAGDC